MPGGATAGLETLMTQALSIAHPLSGRGAAKKHAPTDESALKQLVPLHELPALVLEHR